MKHKFHFKLNKAHKAICISLCVAIIISIGGIAVTNNRQSSEIEVLSKIGSRGDEVRRIQQKLKSLGFFDGAVDGVYGVKTQSAVRRFQKSAGITADGIAGSKTLLYLGLGNTSSAGSGYSSSDVYLLAKVIAAESVVKWLLMNNYQLVTVSELLDARCGGGVAGKVYNSAP